MHILNNYNKVINSNKIKPKIIVFGSLASSNFDSFEKSEDLNKKPKNFFEKLNQKIRSIFRSAPKGLSDNDLGKYFSDFKSIYKLSDEIELDRSIWSRLERVESLDPSFTTIWKIAEALDIYPDELIREVREKLGDDFSLSDLK